MEDGASPTLKKGRQTGLLGGEGVKVCVLWEGVRVEKGRESSCRQLARIFACNLFTIYKIASSSR